MKISKTVKKAISLFVFTVSSMALYSSSKARKQYEDLKRENEILTDKVSKMKTEIDCLSVKVRDSGNSDHDCKTDSKDEFACTAFNKEDGAKEIYTVREYNGHIGIFDEDGILVKEVDIMVSSLPDADRQDLSVGIRVYSSDELEKLLEEFN